MAATITFKNRSDQDCVVSIANCTGTFTPSSEPFVTEEDSPEDLFEPIVTQSGSIKIVADPADAVAIYTSNPLNRKVTLVKNGTLVWTGFLKCEGFSQPYRKGLEEIEMPVVSPLGMLESLEINQTNTGFISFAGFLIEMSAKLSNPWNYFYFPESCNPGTSLSYEFCRMNYLTARDEADADNNMFDAQTYKDVLEDICKLFGWQCHEKADKLYFIAPDIDADYYEVSLMGLSDLVEGPETLGTMVSAETTEESSLDIFSDDNKFDMVPGKDIIDVTGNVNAPTSSLISLNILNNTDYIDGSEEHFAIDDDHDYYNRGMQDGSLYTSYQYEMPESASQSLTPVTVRNVKYQNAKNGQKDYCGGSFANEAIVGEDYEHSWSQRIILEPFNQTSSGVTTSTPAIKITSKDTVNSHCFYGQASLFLQMSVKQARESTDLFSTDYDGTIPIAIMIGDKYVNFDTYTLTDSVYVFTVYIRDGKCLYDSDGMTQFFTGEEGVLLPLPQYYNGKVSIIIYCNATGLLTTMYRSIESLSLKIASLNPNFADSDKKEENSYTASVRSGFFDDYNVSKNLTFANGATAQAPGNGIIVEHISSAQWSRHRPSNPYNTSKSAEQYQGERFKAYFTQSHPKYTITTRSKDTATPIDYYNINDGKCMVLSQSINWRDEELTTEYLHISDN